MKHSGTFFVGSERQQRLLEAFQRREQWVSEDYLKSKQMCFNAAAFQQTHHEKLMRGHTDADATLASPMILGVCDGVSQLEDFGLNPALLPRELLDNLGRLAEQQLSPGTPSGSYRGPVALLREAYTSTKSHGSTTVLMAAVDNSSRIHGKLHSMIAVLSIGDCELLMLRREGGRQNNLQVVFRTEMQRIDQNNRTPLQLSRVTQEIDPEFDEKIPLDTIEEGSAVHCVSAFEGDILVLGSDGVFDNLYTDELAGICNEMIPPSRSTSAVVEPLSDSMLAAVAQRIVLESHAKTSGGNAPIGYGGKADDTAVVVAEVVGWRGSRHEAFVQPPRRKTRQDIIGCIQCEAEEEEARVAQNSPKVKVRSKTDNESGSESDTEDTQCTIA